MKNIHVLFSVFFVLSFITPVFSQDLYYVDLSATGANNGTSPGDAFTSLTAALEAVDSYDDTIKVAQGTYTPQSMTVGATVTAPSASATFLVRHNITLKGGYVGSGDFSESTRDPQIYQTILFGTQTQGSVQS